MEALDVSGDTFFRIYSICLRRVRLCVRAAARPAREISIPIRLALDLPDSVVSVLLSELVAWILDPASGSPFSPDSLQGLLPFALPISSVTPIGLLIIGVLPGASPILGSNSYRSGTPFRPPGGLGFWCFRAPSPFFDGLLNRLRSTFVNRFTITFVV